MTDAFQKEAREVKRYELGVHCSQLCLGGRAILTETTDPDPFLEDVVMATDYDALLARYDEAVQLIEEFLRDGLEPQLARRAEVFLAAEGRK